MCAENCPLSCIASIPMPWMLCTHAHTFFFVLTQVNINCFLCADFFFTSFLVLFFVSWDRATQWAHFGGRFQHHFYGLQLDNNNNRKKTLMKTENENENEEKNRKSKRSSKHLDFFHFFRLIKNIHTHTDPSKFLCDTDKHHLRASTVLCIWFFLLPSRKKNYVFKWHEYNENSGTRKKAKMKSKDKGSERERARINSTPAQTELSKVASRQVECRLPDTQKREKERRKKWRNLKLISKSEIKM